MTAKYRWFVVAVLCLGMALSLIDRFALSLVFEPIKADLGVSDSALGLLHGVAFGLFYAFVGLPIAWLIDRWSRKYMIIIGLSVWTVMTGMCGLASSYAMLMFARIGVGLGEAALAPAGFSLIASYFERRQLALATSIFQMGSVVGAGLAFIGGGLLYGVVEDWGPQHVPPFGLLMPWQLMFLMLTIPSIPLLLLILLIKEPSRRTEPGQSYHQPETSISSPPLCDPQIGMVDFLRRNFRIILTAFLGNALTISVFYVNLSWVPTLLSREFGWDVRTVGLYFGTVLLVLAPIGTVLGGLIADEMVRRKWPAPYATAMLGPALLMAPCVVGFYFADSGMLTLIMAGLIQFVGCSVSGIGPTVSQVVSPDHLRGRMAAIYVLIVNLIGLGIAPVLVGIFSDVLFGGSGSIKAALFLFQSVALISALILVGLYFRIERNSSADAKAIKGVSLNDNLI